MTAFALRHVLNPDFENGTAQWELAPAEPGGISSGKFAGYGQLEGRYPGGVMGDTFLLMARSAKGPNVIGQKMRGG